MSKSLNPLLFGPLLFCCLLSGCDSSPYQLAPVAGTITLNGKPLAGAVVNFQPIAIEGNDAGPGSTGRCDAEGNFQMETITGKQGAVHGEHRVRIYSYSPESPSASDEDDPAGPTEQVPEEYNYKSKLRFTVPADGTETADFSIET